MKAVVEELNAQDEIIDSVKYVCGMIAQKHNITPKLWDVKRVMKRELGMSYKKIALIAWKDNSDRNLILRQ